MTRVSSDVTVETTGGDILGVPLPPVTRERRRIGRYSVAHLLGAGGMGQVYAARDPELDRMVAIKVLRPEMSSLRANSRLHREARAMAKLSHPNLVAVYDVGFESDQLFVAMELIAGQTLRSWVRGKRADEIIESYVAAGRGLAAAHEAGIVHRDFKPDNVLVGDDGRVAVSDFGLARTVEPDAGDSFHPATDVAATQAGTLIGTVRYMAPEQLERRDADERSDQFAFCVALWEALDADPFGPVDPSWDSETFALRRREAIAAQGEARRIGARLTGVPARVRRALARGLALDPAARWPSMAALLAELAPSRRHHLGLAIGAAIGVIVVGAALVFATTREHALLAKPDAAAAPVRRDERTAPSFAESTLWRPTGVHTPASAFSLVDLDGRLQSLERGSDGLLHIAADVKADAALPGSPQIAGDAPAAGVDPDTNTAVIAVHGADGHLYVGTAGPARTWTWAAIGTTDAAPSLVMIDGAVVVAWHDGGHVRTMSRRAAGTTWTAPRDLGEAGPVPPALARNDAHAIAIAFATPDGALAIRRGTPAAEWQREVISAGISGIEGVRLAAWGGLFVAGALGHDGNAYVTLEQPDGRWSAWERAAGDVTVIDPPTIVEYEGVMVVLARDRDRALRYWVRNPNTRAYRYAPAQMWIGGRVVSGFGIGATPPAVAIAGAQLYVATRGIGDQQLYALNLGRFVAVDVLGSVFGIPLSSLDIDPSAHIFTHMRAFLALPGEQTWSIVTRTSQPEVAYPNANRPSARELFGSWVAFDCARRSLARSYTPMFANEDAFVAAAQQYRWGGERTLAPKQYAWLRDHYFDGIEYNRDGFPLGP